MTLKEKLRRLLNGEQRVNLVRGRSMLGPQNHTEEITQQGELIEPVSERHYLQWYEADEVRLRREHDEFKEKYQNFEIYPLGDGRIAWKGNYELGQDTYKIAIIYPYHYPFEPPKVYILEPKVYVLESDDMELEDDGSIPVFNIPGKEWNTMSTAKDIFEWSIEWLHFKKPKGELKRND